MLLLGNALHVHEAGGVGAGYVLCTSGDVTFHLVDAHATADSLLLNGEHAAKATALVRALRFYHLDTIDQFQEVYYLIIFRNVALRRRRQAQLTHAVA